MVGRLNRSVSPHFRENRRELDATSATSQRKPQTRLSVSGITDNSLDDELCWGILPWPENECHSEGNAMALAPLPVSYTHLTLPTTPYV